MNSFRHLFRCRYLFRHCQLHCRNRIHYDRLRYKGTVVSSGISSILYTVTYLGTEIVPVEEEPTFQWLDRR